MDTTVVINEVGPRDGLQNQPKLLSVDERLELIQALLRAGIREIEAASFVSPKAVPAMAQAGELFRRLPRSDEVAYSALVPNLMGYRLAREAGVRSISVVLSATETMNRNNINMGLAEATEVCEEILRQALQDKIDNRAYLAVAFECPYEGETDSAVVRELARRMVSAGASEIIIADTIGAAAPLQVSDLLGSLTAEYGADSLSCHFHDTRGMALANVFAALQVGIRKFDSSIGGLGGCPFAPGATGNVATEDVVLMLNQMGYDTGIDLGLLVEAVEKTMALTGNCPGGHAFRWLQGRRQKNRL